MSESVAHAGCVLVVDDDDDVRETLRDVVESEGCAALLAANGREALDMLAKHRPCLIILDLMMPVMNGTEMLAVLQKDAALSTLPVVISTSAPHLAPRGVPVLPKPIDLTRAWDIIHATCHCRYEAPRRSPRDLE